jgi:hypothetical protein
VLATLLAEVVADLEECRDLAREGVIDVEDFGVAQVGQVQDLSQDAALRRGSVVGCGEPVGTAPGGVELLAGTAFES